jgi:alginate O-acetyltransferase complex protein AlgI
MSLMLLHTLPYLFFLGIVAVVYWRLPRPGWRKAWLLLASYAFYAAFSAAFAALLLALTLAVHGVAQALARAEPGSPPARRWLWLGVGACLAVLGLFKYAGFFMANAAGALAALGLPGGASASPGLRLLLPIGISFYSFQAIAYLAEISRRKLAPASLSDLALYLAFFPKLIAGPLVRPQAFLRQLAPAGAAPEASTLSGTAAGAALRLLLLGLFKKLVIADGLAVVGEAAFRAANLAQGARSPTPLFVQGFYLYAFLIYADFSGYTDLARASALLLGFDLPENFRQPYLAATLGDFWNRWHMSLTQWFREYCFFPLSRAWLARAGRAHATAVQVAVNFVTMLLIGLWHGAAWTFIAWGAWHGLLLSVERLAGLRPAGRWRGLLTGVVTFHLVAAGWVLFHATSLASAGRFFLGLLSLSQLHWLVVYGPAIGLTAALTFGLDLAAAGRLPLQPGQWTRVRPALVTAAVVVLSVLGLLGMARGADALPFIYGQF